MTYQSFRGADLQEALSAVKATLGPNALIEGTRRVSNGRDGALAQQYVEVTAAPPRGKKAHTAKHRRAPADAVAALSTATSKHKRQLADDTPSKAKTKAATSAAAKVIPLD